MKIKLISTLLVMIFILTSWFAWNVYDYNYGKNAAINLVEYCDVRDGLKFRTGIFPMESFQFSDCLLREFKKINERLINGRHH